MNQQAMRQAARHSALDAQAVRRKERADRERRVEGLAVAVLTALGERDAADDDRRGGPVGAPGSRVVRQRRHGPGSEPAAPPGARPAGWRQMMSRGLVSGAVSPRRTGRERPGDRGTAPIKRLYSCHGVSVRRGRVRSAALARRSSTATSTHYPVQHTYPGSAQPPPVRVAAGRDLLPHRLS
jgi:hypothetical protein